MNLLKRLLGMDKLDERVKAIETNILDKRAQEANNNIKQPATVFADDSGNTPWFTIEDDDIG
jgi:hypothetical protein